jgi:hypothetical protein
LYAEQRKAAKAVAETGSHLERAGVVVELKQQVRVWLELHREVTKKHA